MSKIRPPQRAEPIGPRHYNTHFLWLVVSCQSMTVEDQCLVDFQCRQLRGLSGREGASKILTNGIKNFLISIKRGLTDRRFHPKSATPEHFCSLANSVLGIGFIEQ